MKVCLLLLAVFGMSYCAVIKKPASGLKDDLHDLLALLPFGSLKQIIQEEAQKDPQAKLFLSVLNSKDFSKFEKLKYGREEVRDLVRYIEDAGIDYGKILQRICNFIKLAQSSKLSVDRIDNRWMHNVVARLASEVDLKAIANLFVQKLQTSPAFQELFVKINRLSPDYKEFISQPQVQALLRNFKDQGLDIERFYDHFGYPFAWE